jgi:hypothetical protein
LCISRTWIRKEIKSTRQAGKLQKQIACLVVVLQFKRIIACNTTISHLCPNSLPISQLNRHTSDTNTKFTRNDNYFSVNVLLIQRLCCPYSLSSSSSLLFSFLIARFNSRLIIPSVAPFRLLVFGNERHLARAARLEVRCFKEGKDNAAADALIIVIWFL